MSLYNSKFAERYSQTGSATTTSPHCRSIQTDTTTKIPYPDAKPTSIKVQITWKRDIKNEWTKETWLYNIILIFGSGCDAIGII